MNLVAITLVGLCGIAMIAGALLYQAQFRRLDIDPS
jgi:hypothetical protein